MIIHLKNGVIVVHSQALLREIASLCLYAAESLETLGSYGDAEFYSATCDEIMDSMNGGGE